MDLRGKPTSTRPSWLPSLEIMPTSTTFYWSMEQIRLRVPMPKFRTGPACGGQERDTRNRSLVVDTAPSQPQRHRQYRLHPTLCELPQAARQRRNRAVAARGGRRPFAEQHGFFRLYLAAQKGHKVLVDKMYSRAPATLNHCLDMAQTPLAFACYNCHAWRPACYQLGAMQLSPPDERNPCVPTMAVPQEFVSVV